MLRRDRYITELFLHGLFLCFLPGAAQASLTCARALSSSATSVNQAKDPETTLLLELAALRIAIDELKLNAAHGLANKLSVDFSKKLTEAGRLGYSTAMLPQLIQNLREENAAAQAERQKQQKALDHAEINLKPYEFIQEFPTPGAFRTAELSADGKYLLTSSSNDITEVWNLVDGSIRHSF